MKLTDFGYQKVPTEEKSSKVSEVFKSVAPRYDLMNDLMSLGLHRLWKRFLATLAGVRAGQRVLDLAGGTGDLSAHFSRQVGERGQVILADINAAMLQEGRDKLLDKGLPNNIQITQCDAEKLPFPKDYFDCVVMGFGLRNVTHKEKALEEMLSVLKPGGQCFVLEFSKLTAPLLQPLYDVYSFQVLPKLGDWVAGDGQSYQYLAESIRRHPDQEVLKMMMERTGFEDCSYHNMTGGIVAIHRGYKF